MSMTMTDRFLDAFQSAFVPELRRLSSSIDALALGQERIVARLESQEKTLEAHGKAMDAMGKSFAAALEGQGKSLTAQLEVQGKSFAVALEGQGKSFTAQLEGQGKSLTAQLEAQAKLAEDRHHLLVQLIAGNQAVVEKRLDVLDRKIEHVERKIEHLDQKIEHLDQKIKLVDQDLRTLRNASDAVWSGVKESLSRVERRLDQGAPALPGRGPTDPLPDR